MDKAIKKKWVVALRSGEFRQGYGLLYRNGFFCCLGVLRRIANPRDGRRNKTGTFLVREQLNEYGLRRQTAGDLASMNDTRSSFYEIAAYIERWL